MLSSMMLSQGERDLIDALNKLNYGELRNIELELGEPTYPMRLTQAQQRLITEVIRQGYQHIGFIKVHQRDPQFLDVPFEYKGFRGTKLIKLN